METTSFVSPRWVPQTGDNLLLMEMLADQEAVAGEDASVRPAYAVLTPNIKVGTRNKHARMHM